MKPGDLVSFFNISTGKLSFGVLLDPCDRKPIDDRFIAYNTRILTESGGVVTFYNTTINLVSQS